MRISLIPPAVQAEERVFRIKELPVFESSVFLFVIVLRNSILELILLAFLQLISPFLTAARACCPLL